jgi:hypothetical protein
MFLDFLDNVFGLNFPFKAAKGVFQGFPLLQSHLSQADHTPFVAIKMSSGTSVKATGIPSTCQGKK